MLKNIVAIIPARGNSERIKKKNLYPILKKPLLWYSIQQALTAKNITDVFVSSDNDEIINYAKSLNCKTIKRPEILSSNISTSEEALIHAVQFIEKTHYSIDAIMLLQCTSPIRKTKDIDEAVMIDSCSHGNDLLSNCSECDEEQARDSWVCGICGESTYDIEYDHVGSGTNHLSCELEIEMKDKHD